MAQAQARAAITTAVAEDAAAIVSGIAGEGALAQAEARAATEAVAEDAAAGLVSRIAGEGALVQAEARAAIDAVAEDGAACPVSRITGEGASVEGELDGAAISIGKNGTSDAIRVSAGEGEAVESDGAVGFDCEDAALLVSVDGEAIREVGGVDEEAVGGARDWKLLVVAEGDGLFIQAEIKADDFALGIGGAGELVTQGGFVAYSHFRASFDRADGGWAG